MSTLLQQLRREVTAAYAVTLTSDRSIVAQVKLAEAVNEAKEMRPGYRDRCPRLALGKSSSR